MFLGGLARVGLVIPLYPKNLASNTISPWRRPPPSCCGACHPPSSGRETQLWRGISLQWDFPVLDFKGYHPGKLPRNSHTWLFMIFMAILRELFWLGCPYQPFFGRLTLSVALNGCTQLQAVSQLDDPAVASCACPPQGMHQHLAAKHGCDGGMAGNGGTTPKNGPLVMQF